MGLRWDDSLRLLNTFLQGSIFAKLWFKMWFCRLLSLIHTRSCGGAAWCITSLAASLFHFRISDFRISSQQQWDGPMVPWVCPDCNRLRFLAGVTSGFSSKIRTRFLGEVNSPPSLPRHHLSPPSSSNRLLVIMLVITSYLSPWCYFNLLTRT